MADSNYDTKEVIIRMSNLSNTFKILAGTAVVGCEIKSSVFTVPVVIFAIMDIYYFSIEKSERFKLENNGNRCTKREAIMMAMKSFSITGYYIMIIIAVILIIICQQKGM